MQEDHREAPPVNPLPAVVVILFLVMVIPEIVFSLGARGLMGGPEAIGWRLAAVQDYAFSGDIFDWMMSNGRSRLCCCLPWAKW